MPLKVLPKSQVTGVVVHETVEVVRVHHHHHHHHYHPDHDGEYLAYILARQRKFLGQLRPLYQQEKEAAGHLDAMGKETPAPPSPNEGKNP